MTCETCIGKELPPHPQDKEYAKCSDCGRNLAKKKRTLKQNAALHAYFTLVADALDREGVTLQNLTQAIRKAEIRPTGSNIKEVVWKPLQAIITGKESTTQLDTSEIDKVYEVMNKWLAQEFELSVPFPSWESFYQHLVREYEKN